MAALVLSIVAWFAGAGATRTVVDADVLGVLLVVLVVLRLALGLALEPQPATLSSIAVITIAVRRLALLRCIIICMSAFFRWGTGWVW